tara:strand:+ start:174 stop:1202 length:1029 start_codon:yes stop_codon:yes gene_type:complete
MKNILLFIFVSIAFFQDFDDMYFGTENELDIITWNIEWFPKNGEITIEYVTEIIEAIDVDIIAMQELDNINSFNQMMNDLDQYEGYYESGWFAGLAYIYNTETISINEIYEIYTTSPYWSPFPRSPMVMDMDFMGENYIIINNHFKCCGDDYLDLSDDDDEETRRYTASNLLKGYVDNYFPDSNVIILGDLNDNLTDNVNNNVFQEILNDTDNYLFADFEIAQGNSSGWSYPNWPSHLDHILITNELFDDFALIEVIRIDDFMDGGFSEYDQTISDHRPVAIKLSNNSIINGDINNDSIINVVDAVLMVNIVLNNEYVLSADMNSDNTIDVLDVVLLVNIIL